MVLEINSLFICMQENYPEFIRKVRGNYLTTWMADYYKHNSTIV